MVDSIHASTNPYFGLSLATTPNKANQGLESLESSERQVPAGAASEGGREVNPQSVTGAENPAGSNSSGNQNSSEGGGTGNQAGNELTPEEKEQVKKLQERDAEVRAHEAAHKAAAGGLANGGPSYEYQRGPDGKNYAVGGHVNIDTSKGQTPEETIQRSDQIRAAALAPASPSGQDMKVAAEAGRMAMEARRELQEKRAEEAEGNFSENGSADGTSSSTDAPGISGKNNQPSGPEKSDDSGGLTIGKKVEEQGGQSHSMTQAHLQQCPDCMKKFFESEQGNKAPEKFSLVA